MSLAKAEMDIENMKVTDLKKHLKSLGLPTIGNKPDLIERLQDALLTKGEESSEGSVDESDTGMKSGDILENSKEDEILQDDLSYSELDKTKLVEDLYATKDKGWIPTDLTVPLKKRFAMDEAASADVLTRASVISSAKSAESSLSEEEKKSGSGSTSEEISSVPSEPVSPKAPKKIVIKRYAFKPIISSSPKESDIAEIENEAKKNGAAVPVSSNSAKVSVSDEEKTAQRAIRFNIKSDSTVKESTRAISMSIKPKDISISKTPISTELNLEQMRKRAARFGGSVSAVMKKETDLEVMRKRGLRFGCNTSTIMRKLEDEEKRMKRKERFGDVSASNATEQEKKKKRLERFGL